MEAARYNIYWFLTFAVPAVVMLAAASRRARWIFWLGMLLSVCSTYLLSNLSVQTKWRIRNEIAVTDEERAYATADGANLVFTAFFFAPAEAVVYTVAWGWVGSRIWPRRPRVRQAVPN